MHSVHQCPSCQQQQNNNVENIYYVKMLLSFGITPFCILATSYKYALNITNHCQG